MALFFPLPRPFYLAHTNPRPQTRAHKPAHTNPRASPVPPGFEAGDRVEARFQEGKRYFPGRITAADTAADTYSIIYDDGDAEDAVPGRLVRARVTPGSTPNTPGEPLQGGAHVAKASAPRTLSRPAPSSFSPSPSFVNRRRRRASLPRLRDEQCVRVSCAWLHLFPFCFRVPLLSGPGLVPFCPAWQWHPVLTYLYLLALSPQRNVLGRGRGVCALPAAVRRLEGMEKARSAS